MLSCGALACGNNDDGRGEGDDGGSGIITTSTAGDGDDGDGGEGADSEEGADDMGDTADGMEADTGPDTGEDDAGDSTGGLPKFDLGVTPDAPNVQEDGCKKIDFLFVEDNSGSMEDEQANLLTSFPEFINGIEVTLDLDDFHVGVITSDAYAYNNAPCNVLGGLVTATQAGGNCGPYAEGNYMTSADDLATTFPCAGLVGINGNGDEKPMQAMVTAVGPVLSGPGQCNENYIRDDALLVITVITDEEDDNEGFVTGSSGDPASWYSAVVAAKNNIPENVVVLALIGHDPPNACPSFQWDGFDGAEIAPRLAEFANMFGGNGFVGDVCAPNYGPFFEDAIALIDTACDNFTPPG